MSINDEKLSDFDALRNSIEYSKALYSPGLTMRAHRVAEWVLLRAIELLRMARETGERLTNEEAQLMAEADLKKLYEHPNHHNVLKQFEKTAPTSLSVRPSDVDSDIELAAVSRIGFFSWLREQLHAKTNLRGFAAERKLVVAVFLTMALTKDRPDVAATRETLLRGNTLRSWAHDYPDDGSDSEDGKHHYRSLEVMLVRKRAWAMVHINIAMLRRIAALTNKNGRPRHPNAGRWLAADGCYVEADVLQKADQSPEHRELLNGPGREKVRMSAIVKNGAFVRGARGYKIVVIVDIATTLPLIWALVPSSCHEPDIVLELLRELYRLWPDCPAETLSADALYDERPFCHQLVFNFGLHPCIPRGSNDEYSAKLAHVKTEGVPVCGCGDLMEYKDQSGMWPAAKRREHGMAPGDLAPLDFRLRWRCANGNKNCKTQETKPHDDARLYTFLHRNGTHPNAGLRTALMLRRGAVESVFSAMQERQIGGKRLNRPDWAGDDEMEWLMSTGLTGLTARRYVHETDLYYLAMAEANDLGLLARPTREDPSPGPDEHTLDQAIAAREWELAERGELALPPDSWTLGDITDFSRPIDRRSGD